MILLISLGKKKLYNYQLNNFLMLDTILVATLTSAPTILTAYWTYKIKSKPVLNGKFDKLCETVDNLKEKVDTVQERVFELQSDFIDFKDYKKKEIKKEIKNKKVVKK